MQSRFFQISAIFVNGSCALLFSLMCIVLFSLFKTDRATKLLIGSFETSFLLRLLNWVVFFIIVTNNNGDWFQNTAVYASFIVINFFTWILILIVIFNFIYELVIISSIFKI